MLVAACANLGRLNPDKRFFLSSHDAAAHLNLQPKQAHRYLRMLCADNVIELVEPGNQYRATRYRWIGNKKGEGHD